MPAHFRHIRDKSMKYIRKWGVLWKGTLWSGSLANQEQDWGKSCAGREATEVMWDGTSSFIQTWSPLPVPFSRWT